MTAYFISADWSKDPRKRSVYVAHFANRRIRKALPGSTGWNLDSLLSLAREVSGQGRVLVGVDLALGVSRGYWRLVLDQHCGQQPATFVHWLRELDPSGEFFETTKDPRQWRVERPWYAVQKGKRGRTSFEKQVDDRFLRRIDAATNAKPLFAVSGIPGTVGSGTRAFWQELIPRLAGERDFAIWPFEDALSSSRSARRIVLAETYPGLAYAAALAGRLPARRMRIAKTQRAARDCACECLRQAGWVVSNRVDLGDLGPVRASDDDFDAFLTAAAVLRCVIEDCPLAESDWVDAEVEGSMLLAGPVDPGSKARRLNTGSKVLPALEMGSQPCVGRRSCGYTALPANDKKYRCPIPGCDKVFSGSRRGWDRHVESPRMHPNWHPEVRDPDERKRLFMRDYLEWFESASERSMGRSRMEGDDESESAGDG